MKTDLKSTITEQAGAVLGGGFSSLWLPETYLSTFATFSGGLSTTKIISKQGLRIFGKFLLKINPSKHSGRLAIRLPAKQDIYIPYTNSITELLFKNLF